MREPLQPAKEAIFEFGAFELRTETGELFKHGIRIRLQMKPLQVLEALLANPGHLVTREELCRELWAAGTFVDFESGLNTAINRLRAALKDSADSPRYIETLPRLGYRFICPVANLKLKEPMVPIQEPALIKAESQSFLLPAEQAAIREPQKAVFSWLKNLYCATATVTVAMLVALVIAYVHLNAEVHRPAPSFRQLNFRAALVESARFLPGTNKAVYTAVNGISGRQTMTVNLDGSDGRPVSMLADELRLADWSPGARETAVISGHGTESRVEFPAGHVVYRSSAYINNLRVSPNGAEVAFLEHPVRDDDEGYPIIVDRRGNSRILTKLWSSADGLAWSPRGQEVWFTAARTGLSRALYAVSKNGTLRTISNAPSSMRLLDVSGTGKVLVALDETQTTMAARLVDESEEADVTDFDESHVDDISADGGLVLFTNAGNAGGPRYSAYTFDRQSRKAVRFASGRAFALSPDKNSAITIDPLDRSYFTITYLGSKWSRKIQGKGFEYQWVKFHPDGRQVLVGGAYPGQPFQICMQSLEGGRPAPLKNPSYLDSVQVSPDGERIAGRIRDKAIIVDIETGLSRIVPLGGAGEPIAWSHDSRDVFWLLFKEFPSRVVRADWRTGSVQSWKTLGASPTPEFAGLASAVAAPAAGAYAYSTTSFLSRLYVVDGWF